jgi:hypothetical protein
MGGDTPNGIIDLTRFPRFEPMRSLILLIMGSIVFLVAIAAASGSAQIPQSFDPNDEKACEHAVGPREDDSKMTELSSTLDCAEWDIRTEKAEFDVLRKNETSAGKTESNAFNALLAAFERYKALHLRLFENGCGGGNACPALTVQEEARANYEFLNIAEGFKKDGFPTYSAIDLADADATLNKDYQRALANYSKDPCPNVDDGKGLCVSQTEVRGMERAWIRYRDAWVAFASSKWPHLSADCMRTYLTLQQTRVGW